MKTFFSYCLLIFALVSPHAIAETADTSTASAEAEASVDAIFNYTINPKEDAMQYYLQRLFGDFIFEPFGGVPADAATVDATVIAHAVAFSNILALILASVILGYVVLGAALNTAHAGEVLGKSWSQVWLPIRSSIGFFLIMPMPGLASTAGGVVSIAQSLILSLILIGSNAASYFWANIAEVITETPSSSVMENVATSLGRNELQNIYLSLVCAHVTFDDFTVRKEYKPEKLFVMEVRYQPARGAAFGSIEKGEMVPSGRVSEISKIYFGGGPSKGSCGVLDLSDLSRYIKEYGDSTDVKKRAQASAYASGMGILVNYINAVSPYAKLYTGRRGVAAASVSAASGFDLLESKKSNSDSSLYDSYVEEVGARVYNAGVAFQGAIYPAVHAETLGNDAFAEELVRGITRGGWANAGLWFFEIGKMETVSLEIAHDIVATIKAHKRPPASTCTGFWSMFEDCEDKVQPALDAAAMIDSDYKRKATDDTLSNSEGSNEAISDIIGSCGMEGCTIETNFEQTIAANITQKVLSSIQYFGMTNNPLTTRTDVDGDRNTTGVGISDPFAAVTTIGHGLNQINYVVLATMVVGTIAHDTISAVTDGATSSLPTTILGLIPAAAMGLIKAVLTTLFAILMMLAALGFTLAYMIPFMPLIVWIMVLTGYLLTVIEAVVAAPLAVVMMITPEGEGISGQRLERAISLLAMAIMKPSMLIMGLLAAIFLSYVGFTILNYIFWTGVGIIGPSGTFGVMDFALFEIIAILTIYTMAAYNLCKTCIGIIYKLGDQILEWYAGSAHGRSFGENDTGGQLEGVTNQSKQFGNQLTQSAIQGLAKNKQGGPNGGGPGGLFPGGGGGAQSAVGGKK
ncbi:DotA/TraY family protein [Neptuniibacter sp. QD37_11]|uniref:DotA/TraY family protein n=1 Tax=Neptuniibacter sp. QD37_11 TaxID=3398209 RepID=UPI0039F4BDD9